MDNQTMRREAELSAQLQRGPPERGSRQRPITWLFEPESFTPLAKLVADEQLSIVCDHLGAPIAMHDASGAQVWSAQLGTWGDLRRQQSGTAGACPFRWPGQYEDAETGLYYNRFRYYDSEAGQYVSQDPIGLAGGLALYAYVPAPLRGRDPMGLSEACGTKPRSAIQRYYPENDGFGGPRSRVVLQPGTRIDRFGRPHGMFVSPEGVPMPMRALPHDADLNQYRVYEVAKPVEVESGTIAPWFGKPGGGIQYVLPRPASQLVEDGALIELVKP
jgi:RHS repeat-associated protein